MDLTNYKATLSNKKEYFYPTNALIDPSFSDQS